MMREGGEVDKNRTMCKDNCIIILTWWVGIGEELEGIVCVTSMSTTSTPRG